MSSLITDQVNAATMSQFLEQVTHEYPNDEILLVLDGAGWHRAKQLKIPGRSDTYVPCVLLDANRL
jgi:hypothetical protein